eukprot:c24699_g2_i1 orf=49-354(-)
MHVKRRDQVEFQTSALVRMMYVCYLKVFNTNPVPSKSFGSPHLILESLLCFVSSPMGAPQYEIFPFSCRSDAAHHAVCVYIYLSSTGSCVDYAKLWSLGAC